ncbi:MAG TPA: hypothetical protein VHM65_00625, partial [Candidatus Lustribacter sp.]|nr:hypothetical protein [Candidatus Lustribacter sp.]
MSSAQTSAPTQAPTTSQAPSTAARRTDRWRTLYLIGATAALVGVGGALLDIVLTSLPGWRPDTVPRTLAGWFGQLDDRPWL